MMIRYKCRKKALSKIDELSNKGCLIIHYSCESFYNIKNGSTPRITSIAVYDTISGQVDSFSIHKTAEILHKENIIQCYDELEKLMLGEFFDFVKKNELRTWVHINMRDINYGFQAIEHRYKVLKGKPAIIHNNNKVDLAQLIKDIYGDNYIEHPHMENLMNLNNITNTGFLTGKQESEAFDNQEYVKLHQSTLRKVHVYRTILKLIAEDKLKTKAKFRSIYGLSIQSIMDFLLSKWYGKLAFFILSTIIGGFVAIGISNLF